MCDCGSIKGNFFCQIKIELQSTSFSPVNQLNQTTCFSPTLLDVDSLLQESVLELFGVELDPQLVCAHSGRSEENWVFDEVRGRRSPARVRVDHQLRERQYKSGLS